MFDRARSILRQVINGVSNFFNQGGSPGSTAAVVSDKMQSAIAEWMNLYTGVDVPWMRERKQSLGLPAAIASEIARLVTLELKMTVKAPAKQGTDGSVTETTGTSAARAAFLNEQIEPLRDNLRKYCEYGCAGGGLMFKPYFDGENIAIDYVQATDFMPLSFNSRGKITSCIFVEHKKQSDKYYHRIEKHEMGQQTGEDGTTAAIYTVTNKAYKAFSMQDKGVEVHLSEVKDWAHLTPVVTIRNVTQPLFAYFLIPIGNTIDPLSPLGVSVYARAVDLIRDADMQYQRYLWEFEGGELAVEAGSDVFPTDKKGKPIVPIGKERLFRMNALDSESDQKMIEVFSPALREEAIKAGLNAILQKVEFACGLAYGTLSDPQTVDKTATEIKTSKQRSYSTITDIQKSLQAALDDLIYAMNVYAGFYTDVPDGKYEIDYVWDDSIVVDAESERLRDMNEVRAGLMNKWEYRTKWYGEDEDTAKLAIEEMNKTAAEKSSLFGYE
jgi:A118 family predicted phage portal protein